MAPNVHAEFPCSLQIDVPFPTARLSSIAVKAITVDKELSPLVRRTFSTVAVGDGPGEKCVLRVQYNATTNRMLRVAVNSFMDSLAMILEIMERLDVDVLEANPIEVQPGPFR
ncbi:EKC/KEOPS complex subunit PCC1 [Cytospora mali]|uniref:EKC/KEOPS complex subunit PCC1 n=1 Tax=Cytospora mali TaxID=578113 RepID=A0A194UY93_CYTMA|nr:EKC/KEOPS complex subunit PCC1 [Valsa mali var. pyri (nom. inval.)]